MRTLVLILLFAATSGRCASVTLAWDANTETNLAGYKIFWGTTSGVYAQSNVVAAPTTTHTIANLPPGRYYIAATAFLDNGLESDYSVELAHVVPVPPPRNLRVTIQGAGVVTGPWTNTAATASLTIPDGQETAFFRAIVTHE